MTIFLFVLGIATGCFRGGDDDTSTTTEVNIADAVGDCNGYFDEPEPYPNQLRQGDDLHRYTLQSPDAQCNDGTQAVMYVRAATSDALADVWSVHLQGGGSCSDWQDCILRYCGIGYYDASKMSSAWAPESMAGAGIYDADPENELATANHVYLYYCSSDAWGGTGDVHYASPEPIDEPWAAYTMRQRGHAIIEAAFDELEQGIVSDDKEETLDPLTKAGTLIWSGSSAGSYGAQQHADWVHERASANGTRVVAIFDAAITPATETWPDEYHDALNQGYAEFWDDWLEASTSAPFVDQSCWSSWGESGQEHVCSQSTFVMLNHVTTPFFARQDLRDVSGIAEELGLDEYSFEQAVQATLLSLAELPETAIEGADIGTVPGAYGLNCGQHVALENTLGWKVNNMYGQGYGLAFLAWADGDAVQLVDSPVEADHQDGPLSNCYDAEEEE